MSKKSRKTIISNTCDYEVEEILGFKWLNSQMLFFVKWVGWKHTDNTWSACEDLTNSLVFRQYLKDYFISLENEILAKSWKIREKLCDRISEESLKCKEEVLMNIQPFDPWELKVYQIFFHLMKTDENYAEKLEDLTFRSIFFNMDRIQRWKFEEILVKLSVYGIDNASIENNEDFTLPRKFQFITRNMIKTGPESSGGAEIEGDGVGSEGCNCSTCSQFTACCPQKQKLKFPYKLDNKNRCLLRLERSRLSRKIIECSDLCKCNEDCGNRLTQKSKQVPLCLFMTSDRGWGLKAGADISKGSFIMEFVGEFISNQEADARNRSTYMFDVASGSDEYATIDATNYGNWARFINHHCQPNVGTWLVNDCRDDPKNLRLCFFANRLIRQGEELTIDYEGDKTETDEKTTECKCGSDDCRGFIL